RTYRRSRLAARTPAPQQGERRSPSQSILLLYGKKRKLSNFSLHLFYVPLCYKHKHHLNKCLFSEDWACLGSYKP
uniref:Uncharacterized protein n=1 Tax=Monopterus albus TaxID=43700 RepID=A0A3Q3KAH2_MONAL